MELFGSLLDRRDSWCWILIGSETRSERADFSRPQAHRHSHSTPPRQLRAPSLRCGKAGGRAASAWSLACAETASAISTTASRSCSIASASESTRVASTGAGPRFYACCCPVVTASPGRPPIAAFRNGRTTFNPAPRINRRWIGTWKAVDPPSPSSRKGYSSTIAQSYRRAPRQEGPRGPPKQWPMCCATLTARSRCEWP